MSDYWQTTIDDAIAMRRKLHSDPELGWAEERTAAAIRKQLDALDIPWRPCAGTGTVATLNSSNTSPKPHPHIALRGDIDALPIHEQSNNAWRSRNEGCMHACGHDGHTATLLATARWLKHVEAELRGPVSLLFQPAEEGGHGAREMIADGALEDVDEIFGWHNWPAIPYGKLVCPDGIVMCGNGTFQITVEGCGGHASQPELCADPVLAASAITLALQQIVSRRLPPQQAAVVSVTSIEAVSAPTVIPQQAIIGGSIRIATAAAREVVSKLIEEISTQTARAYGVTCRVEHTRRYDSTINHADQAARVRNTWQSLAGDDSLDKNTPVPIMASEDFSYYLQQVPGAFALIGADDGNNHDRPCHSPFYDFNDRLIPAVACLYGRLVGAPLPDRDLSFHFSERLSARISC